MKTGFRSKKKSLAATIAKRDAREPREYRVCPKRKGKPRVPVAVCEKCRWRRGAMRIAEGYYFSSIGDGEKMHIFREDKHDRALCLKGPSYTLWHDSHGNDICKACLRKYEKEAKK